MTATLVARLVEDEVLEFETPLSEIFDDAQLNAAWADQTLADLLRHEAGAPASLAQSYPTLWESMWQRASDPPAQVRADVARELLLDQPPASQGGFTYSNASYLLVGAALEQRTGSSWEQLMRQEVFDPLDMSSCGFGSPASPGQTDQPWGHRYEGGSFEPVEPGLMADNPPALGPAGAVHCSLQDWAKFGRVHLGVGPAGYLGEETLQTLRDPSMSAQNYAMGWYAIQRGWAGSEPALNHAGSNTMNYALAWLAPAKDLGLLIVTNAASPHHRRGRRRAGRRAHPHLHRPRVTHGGDLYSSSSPCKNESGSARWKARYASERSCSGTGKPCGYSGAPPSTDSVSPVMNAAAGLSR